MKQILCVLSLLLLLTSCGQGQREAPAPEDKQEPAAQTENQVATTDQMAPIEDVVAPDMVPISGDCLNDGVYPITVDSSSSMFKIEACALKVENGSMTAVMRMSGTGYLSVFMGTGEEASRDAEIPFTEEPDGSHSFTVPVEALDSGIPCAAFSKNKEIWYDRTLVFRADSLPLGAFRDGFYPTAESLNLPDGTYNVEVELNGGSGRASVQSPAVLQVEDGQSVVTIVWGSSNYDYMRLEEEKLLPVNAEGNSAFEIPVAVFDRKLTVWADTTAMSTPHEIEYTLKFNSGTIREAE